MPSGIADSPPFLPFVKTFTMTCMHRSSSHSIAAFFVTVALIFCTFHAGAQDNSPRKPRKSKVPPPASRIEISVVRDSNGKPVEHAAVIFHPILGDRDNGVMELKTNGEGKAMVDVIPIGDTVRLQIIAKGFQTYGGDFVVDRPEISMEIRLKRPGGQYSIYKNGDTAKSDGSSGDHKPEKSAGAEPADQDKPRSEAAPPNQQ